MNAVEKPTPESVADLEKREERPRILAWPVRSVSWFRSTDELKRYIRSAVGNNPNMRWGFVADVKRSQSQDVSER
jgi:hypothetical protein